MTASSAAARSAAPTSVLIDTNVLLDLILARAPWDAEAARLVAAVVDGRLAGFVAAHTVTTVYYLVEKAKGRSVATTAVHDLLVALTVAPLEGNDFQRALALGLPDFEDAVQVAACLKVGATILVTRNPKDFKDAPVPTQSAAQVLASIGM